MAALLQVTFPEQFSLPSPYPRPIWLYSFWKLAECLKSREEALVGDNLSGCNLYTWMYLNINPLLCFYQILHTVIGICLHYDLTSGLFVAPRNCLPSLTSLPLLLTVLLISGLHTSK